MGHPTHGAGQLDRVGVQRVRRLFPARCLLRLAGRPLEFRQRPGVMHGQAALRQFVTDHYSRRFATVGERWPHSLAFLERSLAAASAEAHQQEIAEFSAGVIREERAVENLVLRILARPEVEKHFEIVVTDEEPHEATADYDVVRRLNAREVARERWTTNMQFVFRDVDPYDLTTNPIGLTITYYAEDRAVSSGG